VHKKGGFFKDRVLPTTLLAGTIIGSGIFALPFLFSGLGLGLSGALLLIFCGLFIGLHLMYGDIVLQEKAPHRLAWFARKTYGSVGYGVAFLVYILQLFLGLTIYIVLVPSFLRMVLPELNPIVGILGFWFLASLPGFVSNKKVALAEFIAMIGIIVVAILVAIKGVPFLGGVDVTAIITTPLALLVPFGALLYSNSGITAIPTIVHYFKDEHEKKSKSKNPIIIGTLIPAILYLAFIAGVWGIAHISGVPISEDGVSGIIGWLPLWMVRGIGALGLLTLWSSYFPAVLDLKESLSFDVRIGGVLAGVLVLFVPILLYFAGLQNFIWLINIVGGLFLGVEGLLIIFLWRSIKKKSKHFLFSGNMIVWWMLFAIFVASIIYTVVVRIL